MDITVQKLENGYTFTITYQKKVDSGFADITKTYCVMDKDELKTKLGVVVADILA